MSEEDNIWGMGKVGEGVRIRLDCPCLLNGKDGKEFSAGFGSHVLLSSMG